MKALLTLFLAIALWAAATLSTPAQPHSVETIREWIMACNKKVGVSRADRYARLIQQNSKKHGVDPALAVALISVESDFNPRTVSHAGAVGLTQVMPFRKRLAHWQVSRGGLMRPEVNIDKGLGLYAGYKKAARGNSVQALNMYVGHGKMKAHSRYSKRVTRRADYLRDGRYERIGKEIK